MIQGSVTFANQCQKWTEGNLQHAKTLEVIPKHDVAEWVDTFLWKGDLCHQDLGGVTTGVWSYRCSGSLADPKRSIDHNLDLVLKPTHGGKVFSRVPEETLWSRVLLSGKNLIDPKVVSPWVKAPSVFTTKDGEFIRRRLQVDELLDIYNAEVITQRELGNCWRSSLCSKLCFFFCCPVEGVDGSGTPFLWQA